MVDIPIAVNDGVITVVATANGQTDFDFDFLIFDKDHVKGVFTELATGITTDLVNITDFTIDGIEDPNGETLTLLAISTLIGDTVTIYLDVPVERIADFQQSGDFFADTINRELDLQTQMMQNLRRDINTAITYPVGDAGDVVLPDASTRASTLMGFDALGDVDVFAGSSGVPVSTFMATLLDDTTSAEARATLEVNELTYDAYNAFNASPEAARGLTTIWRYGAHRGVEVVAGSISNTAGVPVQLDILRDGVGWYSLDAFGAAGDGVTDDTAALQAAIDSGAKVITLASGKSYAIGTCNFDGVEVHIIGYGASIVCTSATGAFHKTDHGTRLTVLGVSFSGAATFRAINYQAATEVTAYSELVVEDCAFDMAAGVYGIYAVGVREPFFYRNHFYNTNSGCGIYFKDTVSPFVDKCIFRGQGYVGTAINYPGNGSPFDAGLILRDSEILGWDNGLIYTECDWLVIQGCTIDYNTQSIKISDQDGANISNNYLGSVANNPALWITGVSVLSEKIIVMNNTFTGHYDAANDYDNVLIDGAVSPDALQFIHNSFTFYTRYGINFTTTARLKIKDNYFAQRAGRGVAPIYNLSGAGDSGVKIEHNDFANAATVAAMNVAFASVNENTGCTTEAGGQAIIGTGLAVFTQAHGCSYTPAMGDLTVSPSNINAANAQPYLDAVDATNITIRFVTATAGTTGVNWGVRRRP